jgi:hypothetical protein
MLLLFFNAVRVPADPVTHMLGSADDELYFDEVDDVRYFTTVEAD